MTGLIDNPGGLNFGVGLDFLQGLGNAGLIIVAGGLPTWSPTDNGGSIVLSNNNLTATHTAFSMSGIRSTIGYNAGKWYWEIPNVNIGNSTTYRLGIANSAHALGTLLGNDGNNGIGYDHSGNLVQNSVNIATLPGYFNFTDFAMDLGLKRFWIGTGSTWDNNSDDPATGVGGFDLTSLMAAGDGKVYVGYWSDRNADLATANFGQSIFTGHGPPAGFQPF